MGKGRAPTAFDYYIMELNEKKRKKYKRCSYAEYQAKLNSAREECHSIFKESISNLIKD